MTTFDFSPLFRSTVGFDRMQRLLDAATRVDESAFSYPPYNIEAVDENAYRITMAVAGFSSDDLDVTVEDNTLKITGRARAEREGARYLHRGIAGRAFERRFDLAEHIKVVGADLKDGLLDIELAREIPEEKRPRKITIGEGHKAIEKKAA